MQLPHLDSDEGSALVEAIGMIALSMLVICLLVEVAITVQTSNALAHAASIAARAGAIGGEAVARDRVERFLSSGVESQFRISESNGLCTFEVRLRKEVRSIVGKREVERYGHAICEE